MYTCCDRAPFFGIGSDKLVGSYEISLLVAILIKRVAANTQNIIIEKRILKEERDEIQDVSRLRFCNSEDYVKSGTLFAHIS